jgi:hypothetical protein
MSPSYPRKTGFAQASLISLDIADTLSDTLFRGHSRFSADGIALPTPRLEAKQSSTDTVELTGGGLKNRADRIVSMTGEASHEGNERFGYWSGYTPAKRTADGTMVPLGSDDLKSEAARFRRGADRAAAAGDTAMAEQLRRTADDLERRTDASG